MSFIPKSPLSFPEIENTPSTPSGTRGIFAKKDGFYEVDSNGEVKKIGSGNGSEGGGGISSITVDNFLSETSENPVQNKVLYAKLAELSSEITKAQNYKYIVKSINETQSFSVVPNAVTYICGILENSEVGEISFALIDAETATENLTEEYVLILDFTEMTTIPAIIFGNDIKWINGEPPALESEKVYMFSFTKIKSAENDHMFYLGIGGEFA